jgi:hypothetical protein
MGTKRFGWLGLVSLVLALGGCSDQAEDTSAAQGAEPEADEQPFTSDQATLLLFEFDGQLVTSSAYNAKQQINDQMLYTIGHLNGDRAVGRLDNLKLSNIQTTSNDDGTSTVSYHAVLPVGWASKVTKPTSYSFSLPKRADYEGQEAFTEKYKSRCIEAGAHDVSSGSMWYYYRPARSGCTLDDADVTRATATVTVSPENTKGRYPEYHKVWEDKELRVVAIFGKYEDGATTGDVGISAFTRFSKDTRTALGVTLTSSVENVTAQTPEVTISGSLADGRKVSVTSLLVDSITSAPESFFARYNELSTEADMIFYNGHAGLGQNVRALAKRGTFRTGKYQIVFMNGCDTFAYVDGSLAETRAKLNPDDPTGTKYMDIVTNVMPSLFNSMPYASLSLIKGLVDTAKPKTYEEIFRGIDKSQVIVVTGEEDNIYTPGYNPGLGGGTNVGTFAGIEKKGSVGRGEDARFETDELPAGSYEIATREDVAGEGGDVDLYVRKGSAPTLSSYDQRPYLDGSSETVTIKLTAPGKLHLMVHGYEQATSKTSSFVLTVKAAKLAVRGRGSSRARPRYGRCRRGRVQPRVARW